MSFPPIYWWRKLRAREQSAGLRVPALFPGHAASLSQTVTDAQASAAASQEESLLPRIYLHGKEVTNETSKLIQKGLLQTADSWTRLDCSGQTGEVHDSWIPIWSCYSHYSSSCLLSYHPPMPPLEHCPPDHRHTQPPCSQLCCAKIAWSGNSYELKWQKYEPQSSACSWAQKEKLRVWCLYLTTLPASLLS